MKNESLNYGMILKDFKRPNPLIYWADLLATSLVAYGSLAMAVANFQTSVLITVSWSVLASFAIYRGIIFNHEVSHSAKKLRGFPAAYNLLIGFTFKFPTYMYEVHSAHHDVRTYGTVADSEYDDLGSKPPLAILSALWIAALVPVFIALRFTLIPILLPFIGSRGRDWIYRYASTLEMNLNFRRPLPDSDKRLRWYIQDSMSFLYTLATVALIFTGIAPLSSLIVLYGIYYLVFVLNFARVTVSHRYSSKMKTLNFEEQILDTVTIDTSPWFAIIWAPLGLRFHTLHHVSPMIPYHQMRRAHRALMQSLPADDPYRQTVVPGYFKALRNFLTQPR